MLSEFKMSILNNWKKYILYFLFLITIFIGLYLGYRYFSYKKISENSKELNEFYKPDYNKIPEYFRVENLQTIDGMRPIEYLRVILVKYYPYGKKEAEKKAKEELELRFRGEKAMALIYLLNLLLEWEKSTEEIQQNTELDSYQKKVFSLKRRKEIFGEELENYLFPNQDYEKIETYFLYTKRYIKKHREDEISEIRDHLQKAKLEIYGKDYERLKELEPFEKKYELELLLQERELEILNLEERKFRLAKIKSKLLQN